MDDILAEDPVRFLMLLCKDTVLAVVLVGVKPARVSVSSAIESIVPPLDSDD